MAKQTTEDLTILDKFHIVQFLSLYPALTLMVFTRRKIGFRELKYNWINVFAILMVTLAISQPASVMPFGFLLIAYAIAVPILGHWQRWKRWCDICEGTRWHTYSPGVSYLEALPFWHDVIRNHRRIYRFVEPPLFFIVGAVVAFLCHALGAWIMLAAVCLYIFEQDLYEKHLTRELDILDGLVASEIQAEIADHYSGEQPEEKRFKLDDTAGIPTGLAPDVQKQIEIRRTKRKPAPENLAGEKLARSVP